MGQALKVAKDDRTTVFLWQAVDLLVDDRGSFIAIEGRSIPRFCCHCRDSTRRLDGSPVADPPTDREDPSPQCDPDRNAIEPTSDRLLLPDRDGPARQDQERRLERVVHVRGIVQHVATYALNHRPMPPNQHLERLLTPLVPTRPKPLDQLPVGQPRAGPRAEQDLKMVTQRL